MKGVPEKNTALLVNDLAIGYPGKKEPLTIAQNLNFSLEAGELGAIVGINGIGKSTLLRTLCTIQPKLSGSIVLDNKALEAYKPIELAAHLSVVLTEPIASKNLSVWELISLGRQPHTNWIGALAQEDKDKIKEAIARVGLDDLKHKKCHELSDGQLQRVLIAKALAQDTSIILLDEPTTHLDLFHKVQILKLLQNIAHKSGRTVLYTSHEIDLAIQLCDKMLIMDNDQNPFDSPSALIKQGKFDTLFPRDTIRFDSDSGVFKIQ